MALKYPYKLCLKKRHRFYTGNNSIDSRWIRIIFGRNTARCIRKLGPGSTIRVDPFKHTLS